MRNDAGRPPHETRLVAVYTAMNWPTVVRLREIADQRQTTMPALVREAVAEWLERQKEGGAN